MRVLKDRSWDGLSDVMLDVGGYALLAVGTVLALLLSDPDRTLHRTTLAIAVAAAAWIYVGYTRVPRPRRDHQGRLLVFWVGLVVLASILMILAPLFFIFMIAGFFYATVLRPFVVAVAAIAVTSILVNSLIAGLPQTATAWTFWLVIIVVQTVVLSAGDVLRGAGRRAERGDGARRWCDWSRRSPRTRGCTLSCCPRRERPGCSRSASGWPPRSTTRSPRD